MSVVPPSVESPPAERSAIEGGAALGLRGFLPRQSPHGLLARFCLAMVATAGFFYINILPALVDGLVSGLQFSTADAGSVASANIYGAAVGALVAVGLVGRVPWRATSGGLMVLLVLLDFVSSLIIEPALLIGTRFVHGLVGGLLVGLSYGIFARTRHPARTFGVLLVVQFGLGGLGVMWLPTQVPLYGAGVMFWCLIAFTLVSAGLLLLLPDYPPVSQGAQAQASVHWWPLVACLGALFFFQAGNNGPYAVILGLSRAFGLSGDYASNWLAVAAWLGVLGASLVVYLSARIRRLPALAAGMALTLWATWGLLFSDQSGIFALANCVVGITWAFVVAYLFGMAAEFDAHGRLAALAGFASKMGLASGPLVVSQLVGEGGAQTQDFSLPLYVSVAMLGLAWLLALRPAKLLDLRDVHERQAEPSPAP